MQREKLNDLKAWKESPYRKPLILRGARQTGKTWLLKEFGRTAYKQCVYVNFEEATQLQSIFKENFDIERVFTVLQIYARMTVTPGDTLIILDEIQSVERGLTSLKYFFEKAPQYHIVAAGSLLGMGLHGNLSFPVGSVDFMDLRPLSFAEFLLAINEPQLLETIRKQDWGVVSVFHEKLMDCLRYYLYVGGMPEVVKSYAETRDWQVVRMIQRRLLDAYEADFSKHIPMDLLPRVRVVWQNIPAQLAKENKKFIYGLLKEGARAREYELAIQWLVDSGLLLKSHRVSKPGMPLVAYQELSVFKLFLHDVGLLGAMCSLDVQTLIEEDRIFTEFKGALTEQYVMQQLRVHSDRVIGYWTNDRSTSEVDFVYQENGIVVPVEVKSGENLKAKSFKFFCDKYQPATAIRTSTAFYKKEAWMINLPLYALE